LASFYRLFIHNFSSLVAPITAGCYLEQLNYTLKHKAGIQTKLLMCCVAEPLLSTYTWKSRNLTRLKNFTRKTLILVLVLNKPWLDSKLVILFKMVFSFSTKTSPASRSVHCVRRLSKNHTKKGILVGIKL